MQHGPWLTDEDLARLSRLGGAVEQIAEAAGVDAAQIRRRLAAGRCDPKVSPTLVLLPEALGAR